MGGNATFDRLPFAASAVIDVRPIRGKSDVIDVVIRLEEVPARCYRAGIAYSEAFGGRAHGYVANDNVFGTGRKLAARIEANADRSPAEFIH